MPAETPSSLLRDAAVRLLLPSAVLVAVNVVVGRTVAGSASLRDRETAAILRLQRHRTPARDRLAKLVSNAADVPASVLHGLVAATALGLGTRNPRGAALPAVALVIETATYLGAGAVVDRPRPEVPRLDHEQPTSSFPSGHLGATVALMVVYARLARGVHSPTLRALAGSGCLVWPSLLAWARVHTGMHYPSDVLAGAVNGVAAGLLAWNYLGGDGCFGGDGSAGAGSAGSNGAVTLRVGKTRRPKSGAIPSETSTVRPAAMSS
ncbi:phosphatase PAP2 family protein [Propionicimonas sp.]|uniref:phosphatase PAP2 family protein n=1 Tax=Propionicimonas sp. TaxID=1955623 RepID=UPI0039E60E96